MVMALHLSRGEKKVYASRGKRCLCTPELVVSRYRRDINISYPSGFSTKPVQLLNALLAKVLTTAKVVP
jgi:hypothetical protein